LIYSYLVNPKTEEMRILIFTLVMGIIFLTNLLSGQESGAETRAAHLGIVYPLSSNGIDAPRIKNRFSLHLFGGVSAGELGICLSGFGHITRGELRGIQMSGFGSVVGEQGKGLLLSGFGNVSGAMQGIQGAGFGNVSGNTKGIQTSGFGNVSGVMQGVQVAGFGNISGSAKGIQSAGFINIADSIRGMQVAGFLNMAGNAHALQVAGFMNIADKVEGMQIAGFMNIADSSDYPIGIINIIKKGEMYIQAGIDELGSTILDFRSGGKYTYGFIGIGINPWIRDLTYFAGHAGIGYKQNFGSNIALRLEVLSSNIQSFQNRDGINKSAARALFDYRIASGKLYIYAGPSIGVAWTEGAIPDSDFILRSWSRGANNHFLLAGFTAGLAYRIR
jgi:hypothetical protein